MDKQNTQLDQLKGVLERILDLIGVSAQVNGRVVEEGVLEFSLSTDTPALIIGYHGATLTALQTVLGVIAYKKFGQTVRVLLDVEGWRKRREETVSRLALEAAQRAKESNTPQPIYNLTPFERRIVHLALANDAGVSTESEGEGRDRYIVVKPK